MQEAGVRLDAGEFSAFEVEDFDGVVARAAIESLATGLKVKQRVKEGGGRGLTQQILGDVHAYLPFVTFDQWC